MQRSYGEGTMVCWEKKDVLKWGTPGKDEYKTVSPSQVLELQVSPSFDCYLLYVCIPEVQKKVNLTINLILSISKNVAFKITENQKFKQETIPTVCQQLWSLYFTQGFKGGPRLSSRKENIYNSEHAEPHKQDLTALYLIPLKRMRLLLRIIINSDFSNSQITLFDIQFLKSFNEIQIQFYSHFRNTESNIT